MFEDLKYVKLAKGHLNNQITNTAIQIKYMYILYIFISNVYL